MSTRVTDAWLDSLGGVLPFLILWRAPRPPTRPYEEFGMLLWECALWCCPCGEFVPLFVPFRFPFTARKLRVLGFVPAREPFSEADLLVSCAAAMANSRVQSDIMRSLMVSGIVSGTVSWSEEGRADVRIGWLTLRLGDVGELTGTKPSA